MKKSKKYKRWKAKQNIIKKNREKPLLERWVGNAKEECYTCGYAGLYFDENEMRFIPFCFYQHHRGKIANISYNKWNDKLEEREKKFEQKLSNCKDK